MYTSFGILSLLWSPKFFGTITENTVKIKPLTEATHQRWMQVVASGPITSTLTTNISVIPWTKYSMEHTRMSTQKGTFTKLDRFYDSTEDSSLSFCFEQAQGHSQAMLLEKMRKEPSQPGEEQRKKRKRMVHNWRTYRNHILEGSRPAWFHEDLRVLRNGKDMISSPASR